MNDERLERELRDALRRHDPGPVPLELLSRIRTIPDGSRPPWDRARSGARSVLGGLAAVAVTAALIGALAIGAGLRPAPGPTHGPSAGPSGPAASPSAAPSPSTSLPGASSVGGYTWTSLPAAAFRGAMVTATVALDGGLIAVTSPYGVTVPNGDPPRPTFWRSTDGLEWQALPDGPAFAGVVDRWVDDVRALIGDGSGRLIAVGAEEYFDGSSANAEAWRSLDGTTWTREVVEGGTDATMDVVYAVPGGFVAVGTDGYSIHAGMQHGTAIWTSSDGRRWVRAATLAGVTIRGVARGTGPYVAVGEDLPARAPVTPIWTSTDGVHLTPVGRTSGVPVDASIVGVFWTGSSFVAIGDRPSGPFVWMSTDGSSWKAGALPVPAGSTSATAAAAVLGGGTLLAVGSHTDAAGAQHGAAWESTDGLDWKVFSLPSAFDGTTFLTILRAGPRLIVVGQMQDGAARTWILEREPGNAAQGFANPSP